jgi:hypothetical protein
MPQYPAKRLAAPATVLVAGGCSPDDDYGPIGVSYPDGECYDRPPWGETQRCVQHKVRVRMRPVALLGAGA